MLKKILRFPEFYIIALILILVICSSFGNVIAKNAVFTVNAKSVKKVFPILEKMENGEECQISFEVASKSLYDLRVVPDDCVKEILVNGQKIPLKDKKGLCDYHNGFVLNKEEFVHKTTDYFKFRIKNNGGPGGLNVSVEKDVSTFFDICGYLILAAFIALCFFVLKRFQVGYGLIIIILLGIVLRMFFASSLPGPSTFGHDVDGHMTYVQYVASNKAIPSNEDCWTCYHPPVYFTVMAPVWLASSAFNTRGDFALGIASFFLSVLTMIIGFFILRKILDGKALYISTLLWTFWPILTVSCSRIGNDQLFYLLHAICLWGGISYLIHGKAKHIFIASIASILAVWTKSTGLITLAICIMCFVMGYFTSSCTLKIKKQELATLIILLLAVSGFIVKVVFGDTGLVNNTSGLHGGLKVGNDFVNFLYVDLQQLIANPFTSPWDDNLGRQYFISYMLKTSLFGEFILTKNIVGKNFAEAVNVSYLLLILYGLRGFWKSKFNRINIVLWAQGFAFILALAYLRNKYPFSCSNDFRYIMPVLLSIIPFIASGIFVAESSFKWKFIGVFLTAMFVISSIATAIVTAVGFN